MSATVASIHQAAQALLDAAVEALEQTAAGFDGVAWLSPGMPAFDVQCDFAAGWMSAENNSSLGLIPSSQQYRIDVRIPLVTLNVTTGRCLTNMVGITAPSIAAKTADAVKHMEDGQALWTHIGNEIADGLFDGTCRQITPLGLVAYTPQGGMGGWNLAVSVQIDGYAT